MADLRTILNSGAVDSIFLGGTDVDNGVAKVGEIEPLYFKQVEVTGNSRVYNAWAKYVIVANVSANTTITLPSTATENIPVGYRARIFNPSNYIISFATEGSDVLNSHNAVQKIPPNSYCEFGKLVDGDPNMWFVSIVQDTKLGRGGIHLNSEEVIEIDSDDVWQEWLPTSFHNMSVLEDINITPQGRLEIDINGHGNNSLQATVFVNASLELPNREQTIEISLWVNGSAVPDTHEIKQVMASAGIQTSGITIPISLCGVVTLDNNDVISLAVKSTNDDDIPILSYNMSIKTKCILGISVDI